MDEKELKQRAVDVLTDKPSVVPIRLKNIRWYERLLIKLNLMSGVKSFTIRPLLAGNRFRIATTVELIPDDILKQGIVKALMNPKYLKDCIYIIGVGIQNDEYEPSKSLVNFIKYHCNDNDLFRLLDTIFATIPVRSFMNSTILIKGESVLNAMETVAKNATTPAKMGPMSQGS